jgi:flagellar basal-body rod protein FlgB
MLFGDIPLVGMLKQRMSWHEQRQGVLAENVANADTPGYKARDIKELSFPELAKLSEPGSVGGVNGLGNVAMTATDAHHIGLNTAAGENASERAPRYEVQPQGNGVVLEDEVMKVSQNVQDFQMVSELYSRGLSMLKLAVRRSA